MKKKLYILLSLILLTQAFVVMSEEKMMNRQKFGRNQKCKGLIYKELGLNDEQIDKLMELKKEEMKVHYKERQKAQNYKHLLRLEMMEEKLDVGEIKELAEKIAEAEKVKIISRLEYLQKLKKILTPGQFKKLNLQMMMKGKRGQGRRGGQGRKRGQKGERK